MSKELEALERIKHTSIVVEKGDKVKPILPYIISELSIIETALKDYERLKQCIDERGNLINECIEVVAEKKLKALEIIKEKVMPFVELVDRTNYKENCYRVYDNEGYEYTNITKEEYDLLKEVLL